MNPVRDPLNLLRDGPRFVFETAPCEYPGHMDKLFMWTTGEPHTGPVPVVRIGGVRVCDECIALIYRVLGQCYMSVENAEGMERLRMIMEGEDSAPTEPRG